MTATLWTPPEYANALDRLVPLALQVNKFRIQTFLLTPPGFGLLRQSRRRKFGPLDRRITINTHFGHVLSQRVDYVNVWGQALPFQRTRCFYYFLPPPALPDELFEHYQMLCQGVDATSALTLVQASHA